MRKFKDNDWDLADAAGYIGTWDKVQVAVLMDIRDELKRMNNILQCQNFIRIPAVLDAISKNTKKKRKRVVIKPKLRVVSR